MKKPKVSLDSAKMQAFFVHHVEKILLAGVVGLMLLLVYQGLTLKSLDKSVSPADLLKTSNDTLTFINQPNRWEEVAPTRKIEVEVADLVKLGQLETDATSYFLPNQLSKPNFPKLAPRTDPELFAPMNLVVVPVFGPLAVLVKPGELDPLYPAGSEESDVAKRAEKKKKEKKKKKAADYDPYAAEMMGGSNSASYGKQGSSRRTRTKTKGGGSSSGSPSGEYGSDYQQMGDESAMMYGSEMGSGSMGGYGYGAGGNSKLYPEALELGFQSNNDMTIARAVKANVIMAVVPYERQLQAYEDALANSMDYLPGRDMPEYLQFRIQRADVTDNPDETDPAVLEELFTAGGYLPINAALYEAIGNPARGTPPVWAGYPGEIIDQRYWDPKLTHPAPPFMHRDLWDLLTHPDVPLASARVQSPSAETPAATEDAEAPSDDLPGSNLLSPMGGGMTPGSGMMSGYGAESGSGGYGSGGYGGTGSTYGGSTYGGSSYGGGSGGYGSGSMGGSVPGYGSGYEASGGMDYGSGGYGSGGYGSAGYGGYGPAMAPPKYKLIRFTDTNVEHGKVYRYRIKVMLNDPNHPQLPVAGAQQMMGAYPAPNPASLHADVQTRLKQVDAEDAKKGENFRTFWRESPWSDASVAAELPSPNRFYVRSASPTPTAAVKRELPRAQVPVGQADAMAVAVVWDAAKAADIPAETKVHRGTVLNFEKDAQAIHPVTKDLIDLPKYRFATNAIVADVAGGEKIPAVTASADKQLVAPGELLIFDERGRLRVQNEVEDIEQIRLFVPKSEEEMKAKMTTPGMEGGSDSASYEDLLNSGSDMYPAPGGSGRRGRGSR